MRSPAMTAFSIDLSAYGMISIIGIVDATDRSGAHEPRSLFHVNG